LDFNANQTSLPPYSARNKPIGRETYKQLKGTTGLLQDEVAKKLAANLGE